MFSARINRVKAIYGVILNFIFKLLILFYCDNSEEESLINLLNAVG